MWTETVTGIDPFVCEGPYVPPRRKRARVTAPVQIESAAPVTRTAPTMPRPISATTGVQVVAVLGLGWYVLFGSGFGGAEGSARPVQETVFDNAVTESKTKQFEQAAPGYIERFAPIAVQEMEKFGIPASISLAQGLLESRAGTSKLALATNNHFGLKCFSRGCKKGHCKNFTDDTHKDFFLNYSGGAWGSWRQHSLLLSQGRYQKLHGRDWKGWADGLQAVGYATDPNYAAALKGIIKRYELYHFDE